MNEQDLMILANIVLDKTGSSPDLDVLTFVSVEKDGGLSQEVRTYKDLWDNGCRLAAALEADGMAPGDRFGLLMQNHPEFVEAMVASSIEGTELVPIDPRSRGDKLTYMLTFAECRGIIVADYAFAQLLEVLDDLPLLEWIWVVETGLWLNPVATTQRQRRVGDILEQVYRPREIKVSDADSTMQLLYTSGTTGMPKAILAPYARFGSIASLGSVIGLREDDRPYTGLSLTHANAQLITLGNILRMGLRGVISRKFTKSKLWDITRRYDCAMFNLLGGMTTAIFSEPEKPDDAVNPVRYVLSAGMPEAIWNDFAERFDVDIYEFYGAAEGGLTLNPPHTGPAGSIGKAPPSMTCTIRSDDDEECEPGVAGQICFRNADGSAPPIDYYKNPEASAKKSAGGWLRMGDVGHMDAEGWIFFHYRKGGGIRRYGDFINPAFVEKAIAENETVSDVFVYGVPMENGAPGEKNVVAAIVPEDAKSFAPAALFSDCRDRLEKNYVPTYLQVLEEIPKTASEKPQERICLELFEQHPDAIFIEQPTPSQAGGH